MKKYRAKAVPFLLTIAIALLKNTWASEHQTKAKKLPSPEWHQGNLPVSFGRTHDEDLLKDVIHLVSFDCTGKTGYFSDPKFNCEVFHYCKSDGVRNTFHCPKNSVFNHITLVCEVKSEGNVKLCQGGVFASSDSDWSPITGAPIRPRIDAPSPSNDSTKADQTNGSKSSMNVVVTLEDLLSFMNGDFDENGVVNSPTKDSSFHSTFQQPSNTKESQKTLVNATLIKDTTSTSVPETSTRSASVFDKTVNADLTVSTRTLDTTRSESFTTSESKEFADFIPFGDSSVKTRQHKRIGKVIDLVSSGSETVETRKPERSLSTRSLPDSTTTEYPILVSDMDPDGDRSKKPPKLFDMASSRSRTKDYRKKKRNSRRKHSRPSSSESTTRYEDGATISPIDLDNDRSSSRERPKTMSSQSKKRKSSPISEREKNDGWHGLSHANVRPYKLPPISEMESQLSESSTKVESIVSSSNQKKGGRRPSWHSPSPPPSSKEDEADYRYGDRSPLDSSEKQRFYGDDQGSTGPRDVFGIKEVSDESEEAASEENPKIISYKKNNRSHRDRMRSASTISESTRPLKASEDRDESMWIEESDQVNAKSRPHSEGKSKSSHRSRSKSKKSSSASSPSRDPPNEEYMHTGDDVDEHRQRVPYKGQYTSNVKELEELEKNRWKVSDEKNKNRKPSSISDSVKKDKDSTTPSLIEDLPSEPLPSATSEEKKALKTKIKQLPKHTAAHQQLSKLMNDFFSANMPKNPKNKDKDGNPSELHVPGYRIPDEDIYAQAEAEAEFVENLPQEVLDVVEFLTKQTMEKEEEKIGDHKVVKLDANIKDIIGEELASLLTDEKIMSQITGSKEDSKPGTVKKIIIQPEDKIEEEEEEDMKEIAKFASFTSLRMEPMLKSVLNKPLHVIPLDKRPYQHQSKVRQISSLVSKPPMFPFGPSNAALRPAIAPVSSKVPNLPMLHSNTKMMPAPATHFSVYHPPAFIPPLPQSIPSKSSRFRSTLTRPLRRLFKTRRTRQKRSLASRLRRQITFNPNQNPFYAPFFKSFNPNFPPNLKQFRNIFGSPSNALLNTAGSHQFPLAFPTLRVPKMHTPPKLQHFMPMQTMAQNHPPPIFVNEVPVPVHVEVHNPAALGHVAVGSGRPLQPEGLMRPRKVRNHSPRRPPPIQRPPLITNSYVMHPSTAASDQFFKPNFDIQERRPRPPPSHGRSTPSSDNMMHHMLPLALPISQVHVPSGPQRPSMHVPVMEHVVPPGPSYSFQPHMNQAFQPGRNAYLSKLHGPITDHLKVLANDEPGLLMHSGYKPPKTSKPLTKSKNDKKPTSHSAGFYEITYKKGRTTPRPMETFKPMLKATLTTPSWVSSSSARYRDPPFKPMYGKNKPDSSSKDFSEIRHSSLENHRIPTLSSSEEEAKMKRRRPNRRRRPRPRYPKFTPTSSAVSATPPPPEQIPAPPSHYTAKPYASFEDVSNSLKSESAEVKPDSLYPPAGYYGRDQLGQVFNTLKNSEQKLIPKNHQQKDLGEMPVTSIISSSSEIPSETDAPEVVTVFGDEPAFGARLNAKNGRKSRRKKGPDSRSQISKTETRANHRYTDISEDPRRSSTYPPKRKRPSHTPRPVVMKHHILPETLFSSHPVQPALGFFNVPTGLGGLVAPAAPLQHGQNVPRDMFGIPIPFADPNLFPGYGPNGAHHHRFFSVPSHIAQQQLAPLQKEKKHPTIQTPPPFFTQTEGNKSSKSEPSQVVTKSSEQTAKPKRKRVKVKSGSRSQYRSSKPKVNKDKSSTSEENHSTSSGEGSWKATQDIITTTMPTTFSRSSNKSSSDSNNLPPSLQEVSKSLLEGKLDIKKLNATISTSVSVSASRNDTAHPSEEEPSKKVFSSKNGGLAVMKKGPRNRKRIRVSKPSKDDSSKENGVKSEEKLQIASSILDIIKATTDVEKNVTDPSVGFSSTKISKTWILKPPTESSKKVNLR